MSELTVKCPICGKPYVQYAFMAGDQSACPECREEAHKAAARDSNLAEKMRRERYFGMRNINPTNDQ